jgi:hypothetical protein
MTRGRTANHAYVALDQIDPTCPNPPDTTTDPTPRRILERVLATDGAEQSATTTLRRRQDESGAPSRLVPIRETLTAAGESGDADCSRAAAEVRRLIAARTAALLAQPYRGGTSTAVSHHQGEGIHR